VAVVCERNKSTISCKTGHTISIVQANYGRYDRKTCPSQNMKTTNCFDIRSTSTLKTSCNGRRSCSLFADNSVFGDPCKGTHKYIRVFYKCRKSIYNRVVLCERSSRSIKCPKGLLINIKSASYGRQDRNTCPSSSIKTTSCSARRSSPKVKARCQYKNSCWLQASNSVFGDPCKGTYKYLSVSYSCKKPRRRVAVACERKPRWITCPYGTRIKIHSANYGRTDVRTCLSRSIKNINCYAKLSKFKVASSCNGNRKCLLKPFNAVFGDPCKGTYKYLRVSYDCI